jgi:catechol 2,3-dioxygenase
MARVPNAQLTHVGLYVRNIAVMSDFYCKILGLVITDSGPFQGRELAFFSRNANEHHQIVMVRDPSRPEAPASLNQISFRLDNLEALRQYYAYLSEQRVEGLEGRNHGNSWSAYFFDPEGNKIEVYVPTSWHVSQPWRAPLDLTLSADEIISQTERLMRENPTSQPAQQWSAAMSEKLAALCY